MQLRVHQLVTHLIVSQIKLEVEHDATAYDDDLQLLSVYILNSKKTWFSKQQILVKDSWWVTA